MKVLPVIPRLCFEVIYYLAGIKVRLKFEIQENKRQEAIGKGQWGLILEFLHTL